eukprot:497085-Amphidinium_carterae.1
MVPHEELKLLRRPLRCLRFHPVCGTQRPKQAATKQRFAKPTWSEFTQVGQITSRGLACQQPYPSANKQSET